MQMADPLDAFVIKIPKFRYIFTNQNIKGAVAFFSLQPLFAWSILNIGRGLPSPPKPAPCKALPSSSFFLFAPPGLKMRSIF